MLVAIPNYRMDMVEDCIDYLFVKLPMRKKSPTGISVKDAKHPGLVVGCKSCHIRGIKDGHIRKLYT